MNTNTHAIITSPNITDHTKITTISHLIKPENFKRFLIPQVLSAEYNHLSDHELEDIASKPDATLKNILDLIDASFLETVRKVIFSHLNMLIVRRRQIEVEVEINDGCGFFKNILMSTCMYQVLLADFLTAIIQ